LCVLIFLIQYIYIGHFKHAKDDAIAFARAILLVIHTTIAYELGDRGCGPTAAEGDTFFQFKRWGYQSRLKQVILYERAEQVCCLDIILINCHCQRSVSVI
jgi:hypothetical protein